MQNLDFTPIVQAIITLAAAAITIYLVPYLKSKIGETNFNNIMYWVKVAVEAAEQKFQGSGRGAEKKAAVEQFLLDKGIKVNLDELDNLIESVVHDMNAGKSE